MRNAFAVFAALAVMGLSLGAIAQQRGTTAPPRVTPPPVAKPAPQPIADDRATPAPVAAPVRGSRAKPGEAVLLEAGPQDRAELAAARKNAMTERLRSLVQQLPKANLAAINASAVPVLMPADPRFVSTLQVTDTGQGFIAQMTDGPAYIEIHGTNVAVQAPARVQMPKTTMLALADGGTLRNVVAEDSEMGVELSFTRFGMAYSITIGCDDPAHDRHCTRDYSLALARSMVVLGGGQP